MDDLATLLERVEKATRKSDDLDQHIFAWHRGWSFPLFGAAHQEWNEALRHGILVNYTASLDAALALVEEKGFEPNEIEWHANGLVHCLLDFPGGRDCLRGELCANPSLAVLSALLRALLTQESKNG